MRNAAFMGILSFIIAISKSQATFQKKYSAANNDIAITIKPTIDGGFILGGRTNSFTPNDNNLLIKMNSNSSIQWSKIYTQGTTSISAVLQTSSGKYICVGYGPEGGYTKATFFSTDQNGTLLWAKTYNTVGSYWEATSIIPTLDEKFVISGIALENGEYNPFIFKIDTNGNILSSLYDKSLLNVNNKIYAVHQLPDSSYFGVGVFGNTLFSIYCIIVDKTLSSLSPKTLIRGTNPGGVARSIAPCSNGDVIIVGNVDVGNPNGIDFLLMRINPNLVNTNDIKWAKTLGGPGIDILYSVKRTSDSNYIACGKSNSYGNGDQGIIIKFDTLGNILYAKTFGASDNEICYDVLEIPNDTYLIIGTTSNVNSDIFLIKTVPNDTSCWLSPINLSSVDRTSEYSLTSIGGTSNTNYWSSTITFTESTVSFNTSDICIITSMENLNNESGVKFFLNPIYSQATLKTDYPLQNATLIIYNALGDVNIKIHNLYGQINSFYYNPLPAGIYFIQLIEKDRILAREKLLITH